MIGLSMGLSPGMGGAILIPDYAEYIQNSANLFQYWNYQNTGVGYPTNLVMSPDYSTITYVDGSLGRAITPIVTQRISNISATGFDVRRLSFSMLIYLADPSLYTQRSVFGVFNGTNSANVWLIRTELLSGNGKNLIVHKVSGDNIVIDWTPYINTWTMLGVAANALTEPYSLDVYVNGNHVGSVTPTPIASEITNNVFMWPEDPSRAPNWPRRLDELAIWTDYKPASHFQTLYEAWQATL